MRLLPTFVVASIGVLAATRSVIAQIATPLPAVEAMPESTEVRLALSAAPAAVSDRATVLVHRGTGLEPARHGDNGYVCFIEYFEQAPVTWPVCYEPEMARVVVPLNKLLEHHRAARTATAAYRALRDSLTPTLPIPKPGGVSYRLSPAMSSRYANGKTPGPWMILVTSPHAQLSNIGFPTGTRSTGVSDPKFGIANSGQASAYFWIDVAALTPAAAKP